VYLKPGTHWRKSTVAETGDKSATKSTVVDTVDFVAGFGDKSATTWIRQLVVVDFVANLVEFVGDSVNFVASVYGAEVARRLSTRSTVLNSTCVPGLLLLYICLICIIIVF